MISHTAKLKKSTPYLYIAGGVAVVFCFLALLPAQRVGDGSEYYALFYAWHATNTPWMTSLAYDAYERLYASGEIMGLMSREWLENIFPSLRIGDTADFNHFWFYSFLAYAGGELASIAAVDLSGHESFLLLHFFLLLFTTSTSFYCFGWRGVFVVLLMTLASPMLWFLDKVHTEFFTYCLALSAVIFVDAKRYLAGAFLLALASTQNPSFALIALLPFSYRCLFHYSKPYNFIEVCLFAGTVLAVLIHPAYYYSRFGVLTPQLLAGGASLGGNLSSFYIWLFDPDLGLLPNWPLGALAVLVAAGGMTIKGYKRLKEWDGFFLVFTLSYLAVNFYAHSSTTNLNSGATPGLARYALWYLPLAFPLFHYVFSNFLKLKPAIYVITLVPFLASSAIANDPRRHEQYSEPATLSRVLQTYASWLYDPPAEVFAERYSGLGEAVSAGSVRGVLGPDCRKLLLFPGGGRSGVTVRPPCMFDQEKLTHYADSKVADSAEPFYTWLEDGADLVLLVSRDAYRVGARETGNFVLGSGWSSPENWGVWSDREIAKLVIPCNSAQFFARRQSVSLSLGLVPFGKQDIKILQTETLWQGSIADRSEIKFSIPLKNCESGHLTLEIQLSNPQSPLELGQSADSRKLGIGLTGFRLE